MQIRCAGLLISRPPGRLRAANSTYLSTSLNLRDFATTILTAGWLDTAYVRRMQDPAEIRRRKGRSNRTVLLGLGLIVLALVLSFYHLAPDGVTTLAALAGFGSLLYGVHVGWLVFYDREPDGPPS